jgi:hypothetical protein
VELGYGRALGTAKASSMKTVRGMVYVAGFTYRIVRVQARQYEVVRILDDAHAGSFRLDPRLELTDGTLGKAELREVALAAIREAKTDIAGGRSPR